MHLDRGLLLGFVGLLLALSIYLVFPYSQFFVAAVLIAFVLQPLQRRLAPAIGEKLAAVALVFATLLAFVLPIALVFARIYGDAVRVAQNFDQYRPRYDRVEAFVRRTTGLTVDLEATAVMLGQQVGTAIFGGPQSIFSTALHAFFGIGFFVFLLFFLVRDGGDFATWLHEVSPLPDPVTEDLLDRLAGITRAVLVGHVLVALIQGTLAGVALFVLGVPNAVFWTFVMIVLALIPFVGSFVVWAPASAWLFVQGRVGAAIGLAVYGVILVSLSDDYLRPVITDRYAEVNPAVIIVGVVGGLAAFGFVGLFVGPIVVGALKESAEIYAEYYGKRADTVDG